MEASLHWLNMERLIVKGGNQLHGDVNCSGAKNAGLPIIAATILLEKTVEIEKTAGEWLMDGNWNGKKYMLGDDKYADLALKFMA